MNKDQAYNQTIKRFTNLLDGKILSGISVAQVIDYYESLVNGVKPDLVHKVSNIESNFLEDMICEIEDET